MNSNDYLTTTTGTPYGEHTPYIPTAPPMPYGLDFASAAPAPPVDTSPKKKSLKMEVELCLCSKALWS